jgi:hypothetical protein
MARKRYKPEEIVAKLQQIDVLTVARCTALRQPNSTLRGHQAELGPNIRSMTRSAPASKQRPWLSTIRCGCQE